MHRLFALVLLIAAVPARGQTVQTDVYYVFCDPEDPRTLNGAHDCGTEAPRADRDADRLLADLPSDVRTAEALPLACLLGRDRFGVASVRN